MRIENNLSEKYTLDKKINGAFIDERRFLLNN